ncbi:hypothetical protein L208DRAFT_1096569, partial [Tricholoma matsutake]
IIEAICADGTELKPGFVFPGTLFSPEGFDSHPDIVFDVSVATSQNGWTDDFIGAEWFEKSFIPQST